MPLRLRPRRPRRRRSYARLRLRPQLTRFLRTNWGPILAPHFHPEHAFGAQVFADEATYLLNTAQADDLTTKGEGYLGMFRQLGEPVARELEGVRIPVQDQTYDGTYELDLGGRSVQLRPTGRAHSKGDQVITVPDAGVLFTGDLAEADQFAIFRGSRRTTSTCPGCAGCYGPPRR
ncbi:MBL fold metallo-hydrolase [Kribbella sp. VKM Ac-2566]|uniref:MBL fold metallo-hydrolase n=1 Tax=Kribbella sp. VKM Ac-2566 TaxID=2512218 RepID=UPI00192DA40F|nr:MBL fold metallo-hydrolase [Kribbella sp. VKM Ac-2566]